MNSKPAEIPADELTVQWDTSGLRFDTTEELEKLDEIMGQDRAVKALDFGVEMQGEGYNIYVLGPIGAGKTTATLQALKQRAASLPVPDDWCYVNNFADDTKPIAIRLKAGKANEFKNDAGELIQQIRDQIHRAFEGEYYQQQRNEIRQKLDQARNNEMSRLQELAKEKGFTLQQSGQMFGIVPTEDGKPLTPEEYEQLSDERKKEIDQRGQELREEMRKTMQQLRQTEKEVREKLRQLDRSAADFAIGYLIDESKSKYRENKDVHNYLDAVRQDVVEHVQDFLSSGEEEEGPTLFGLHLGTKGPHLEKYAVNVMVDNSKLEGPPVLLETNPSYHNLIGRIEHRAQFGAMVTDFTLVKPGALHRANGGYLVLDVLDLLRHPFSWDALKRCLKSREIKIEELAYQLRLISTVTLEPQPMPLNVKVVLIGRPLYYYLLHALDEDYRRLFKIKADFDDRMDRTEDNIFKYAHYIASRCKEENLLHFDKSGLARILEYSSRMVEDQEKLAATFSIIADVVREAHYWAKKNGHSHVAAEHVEQALQERVYRANRIEERIRELVRKGIILVDVDGAVTGQVNGLSVSMLGDYAFGRPSRITARTFPGRGKVVDIARETEMGGSIHSKGVLILSGYLAGQYSNNKPLSLSASLCFEQVYEMIEGDSASVAELCALISGLGDAPIKQGIAVTGSVNQHGEVQPVGGVTYKVEGFFKVCEEKGLTGEQGVIVPDSNRRNLMLEKEVRDAVAAGKFHIYPVKTVDEALHILTGTPAGKPGRDGSFPEGTLGRAVVNKLGKFLESLKKPKSAAGEAEEKKRKKGTKKASH